MAKYEADAAKQLASSEAAAQKQAREDAGALTKCEADGADR